MSGNLSLIDIDAFAVVICCWLRAGESANFLAALAPAPDLFFKQLRLWLSFFFLPWLLCLLLAQLSICVIICDTLKTTVLFMMYIADLSILILSDTLKY